MAGNGLFARTNVTNAAANFRRADWGADDKVSDFGRRFGVARLLERNQNLIKVLGQPEQALQGVQDKLYKITKKKSARYQEVLAEFRNLGFSEEESISRADSMIGREMETDLALLQVQEPYALGGAAAGGWDPVSGMLRANPVARDAPRTFAAIGSSGGLGVSGKGGKEGKVPLNEKKRLRKKWKRQRKHKKKSRKGKKKGGESAEA